MEYRTVGRTGVKVSSLCFGTGSKSFGAADRNEASRMFRMSLEAGVNFFDTADIYADGESERRLGELMAGMRDDLVIATKVYGRTGPDINARGLSRRHITRAVEASLERLGTDRLDFYFLHHFDSEVAIEETLTALDDLVRQGLVLYPAASNWAAWQVMKALGISNLRDLSRFELIQPMYNLLKRRAEAEILPMAVSEQLGVITYSPLAGGLLSGKYALGQIPDEGRLVTDDLYRRRYRDRENYRVAQQVTELATELGVHPVTLSVAWVKSHPAVTAPIVSARNAEQLMPALEAAEYLMPADVHGTLTRMTGAAPSATDRSENA